MPAAALEYDSIMGRSLHIALGAWFMIATTIAQGCAGPAQNASAYNARNATTTAATASRNGAAGPSANASRANTHLNAHGYVSDPNASAALTDYFKHHRLPLVGAQVLRNPNDGSRAVVLYGFVGSDFGKSDAQRQAEDFINDASVDVDNRIRVNPDLLTARTPADTASSVADDPDGIGCDGCAADEIYGVARSGVDDDAAVGHGKVSRTGHADIGSRSVQGIDATRGRTKPCHGTRTNIHGGQVKELHEVGGGGLSHDDFDVACADMGSGGRRVVPGRRRAGRGNRRGLRGL